MMEIYIRREYNRPLRDESYMQSYLIKEASSEELGWLGYYIGQNTKLKEINFCTTIDNESFYKEVSNNMTNDKV